MKNFRPMGFLSPSDGNKFPSDGESCPKARGQISPPHVPIASNVFRNREEGILEKDQVYPPLVSNYGFIPIRREQAPFLLNGNKNESSPLYHHSNRFEQYIPQEGKRQETNSQRDFLLARGHFPKDHRFSP